MSAGPRTPRPARAAPIVPSRRPPPGRRSPPGAARRPDPEPGAQEARGASAAGPPGRFIAPGGGGRAVATAPRGRGRGRRAGTCTTRPDSQAPHAGRVPLARASPPAPPGFGGAGAQGGLDGAQTLQRRRAAGTSYSPRTRASGLQRRPGVASRPSGTGGGPGRPGGKTAASPRGGPTRMPPGASEPRPGYANSAPPPS